MSGTAIIWINDLELPAPDVGMKILRQQLVNSARNANGVVVAQTINRRLIKLDSLQWSYLDAYTWHLIVKEINKFKGNVTFWDAGENKFITIGVYWGDATEEPYEVDDNGSFKTYKNCKCNIIDLGGEMS